jgi:hypothetical protein
MRRTLLALCAGIGLTYLGEVAAWAQAGPHLMVLPEELAWTDMPTILPGAKLAVIEGPLDKPAPFTFRLRLPANYHIPAHWHPWVEHVTVLSGTLNMGTGDKLDRSNTRALSAGGVAVMPAQTPHFSWTREETIVQIHGVGGPHVVHKEPILIFRCINCTHRSITTVIFQTLPPHARG